MIMTKVPFKHSSMVTVHLYSEASEACWSIAATFIQWNFGGGFHVKRSIKGFSCAYSDLSHSCVNGGLATALPHASAAQLCTTGQ